VLDPRSGNLFTDFSAWEFIVELLTSGHPIEEIVLDIPPGKKAYVLKTDEKTGYPSIYIKLQLLSGCVLARSFHVSDPTR
jgi:hypothetical protein